VIFVDQATDASLSSDAVPRKIDRLGKWFQRRGAVQGTVWPVLIVMGLVVAQDPPQMGLVPGGGAVKELASASADPAFVVLAGQPADQGLDVPPDRRSAGPGARGPGSSAAADDVTMPAHDRVRGNQQPQAPAPHFGYHGEQGREQGTVCPVQPRATWPPPLQDSELMAQDRPVLHPPLGCPWDAVQADAQAWAQALGK
jgi:hypothetical protein